jgi:xanthine/uracil permease
VFMAVAGICALSRDPLSDNAAMVIAIVVGGSLWAGLTRGAAPGIFKPGFGGFLAAYLASAVTFAAMAPLIWFEIKHPREFREALSFSASHTPPQEIPCCADAPWSSKCRLCLGRTPSSPVR